MKGQIQKAYSLTTDWQQIEPQDSQRRGTLVQNQTGNGTANIYVSEGRPTSDYAAIELAPNGVLYEDILPPHGSIWVKTDAVGGATITLVVKY